MTTTMPCAIIVDIDGTLAKMGKRRFWEWGKVGLDTPHWDIISLSNLLFLQRKVILCSGRDAVCRPETEAWLAAHRVNYTELHMRPAGNNEKDCIIKERIYREHIEGKYNVDFVIDDRNQVVQMWRSLGLRCLQVADGDF